MPALRNTPHSRSHQIHDLRRCVTHARRANCIGIAASYRYGKFSKVFQGFRRGCVAKQLGSGVRHVGSAISLSPSFSTRDLRTSRLEAHASDRDLRLKAIISDFVVGAFVVMGAAVCYFTTTWADGKPVSVTEHPYNLVMELPFAYKVHPGTPVRMRGVEVGAVQSIHGFLDKVDVVLEMNDAKSIVVPRGSVFHTSLTGLTAEAFIDITPPPQHTIHHTATPLDPGCEEEATLYCHMDRVQGSQGPSSDEMLRVMLRIARGESRKDMQRK